MKYTPAEYAHWVADIIEANPNQYVQHSYFAGPMGDDHTIWSQYVCSTACCLAGWTVACAIETGDVHPRLLPRHISDVAHTVLGLGRQGGVRDRSQDPARDVVVRGGSRLPAPLYHSMYTYSIEDTHPLFDAAPPLRWPHPWGRDWEIGGDALTRAEIAADLLRVGCQPDGSWRMPS